MQITIICAKEVAALTALIALTPSRFRFPMPRRSFVSALNESLPTRLNRYLHFFYASQSLVHRWRADESVRPEYSPHIFSAYRSCRDSRVIELDVSMSMAQVMSMSKTFIDCRHFFSSNHSPISCIRDATSYLRIRKIYL